MYSVECDEVILYDDVSLLSDTRLINPKFEISDNGAGKFTTTVPPDNRGYNSIKRIMSTITIKKDGKWFWSGRVLSDKTDFYGRKEITCEGALAFLNDKILPPKKYVAATPSALITMVLNDYNENTNNDRKIYAGAITVYSNDLKTEYIADYVTPLSFLNDELINPYGGHLFINKAADGTLRLNYYQDYPNTATQSIDFGVNLLDYSRNYDLSNICTVVIPRGKKISTDNDPEDMIEGEHYTTIAPVNKNSIYLVNEEAVKTYGRVEKTIDFSDVDDPSLLLKLGQNYLSNYQFDNMQLEIKAIDLHALDPSIKSFEFLDLVRCISLPHGMDKYFPVTSISIPLDQPDKLEYTLGVTQTVTITSSGASLTNETKKSFDKIPTRESVLIEANRNANEILSRKTTGYVNIVDQGDHSEALVISNTQNWIESSRYWKFDMNGLGYFVDGKNKGIAITMNGEINADFITAGTLHVDNIGITGMIKDLYGDNMIDFSTGKVYLSTKSTVVTDGKNSYGVASSNDINNLSKSVNNISQKQTTIQTDIDGIYTSVTRLEAKYGRCITPGNTVIKQVTCPGFAPYNGAIIVVYFSFANKVTNPMLNVNNTGAHYITLNGGSISDIKKSWGNAETVTFVYDGKNYCIANGATESHIKQLADSITLSVSNGALGNTATIALYSDENAYKASLNLKNVKKAWAEDTSVITMSAGKIKFDTGTFELNSNNCTISADGIVRANKFEGTDATLYGRITSINTRVSPTTYCSMDGATIWWSHRAFDDTSVSYIDGGPDFVTMRSRELGLWVNSGGRLTITFWDGEYYSSESGYTGWVGNMRFIHGILVRA